MNETFLIIVTFLSTLCAVFVFCCLWLAHQCIKAKNEARQIASDLKTAHNTHAETVENVIAKINDLQTQLAFTRQQQRKTL